VPRKEGGRVAVCEILRSNSRTKEYVQEGEREGKSLQDAMEAGSLEGMQTFDGELEKLIHDGTVDREVALSYSTNRTNLELRLSTQGAGDAEPAIPLAPSEDGFAQRRSGRPRPTSAPSASAMDDLLER